jgi:hydroxymethylpyrimidine pyrophosphatase-like HAD family hydrolase
MYLERTPQSVVEAPIPSNKLALIDLDGTLIDASYQLTDPNITEAIHDSQELGWQLGLSSDSGLESLINFQQELGMNGPIIAERGAIVKIGDNVIFDGSDALKFRSAQEQMVKQAMTEGVVIWNGDAPGAIRKKERIGLPGQKIMLINALRRESIGLYLREVNPEGALTINNDLTDQVVYSMRESFPDFDDLIEDLNHDYGSLILSRGSMAKRVGTQVLMEKQNLHQIGMIGNAITDFIGEDIALHYAVGNSTDEFKSRSVFVASQSYTSGVIEIFDRLTA